MAKSAAELDFASDIVHAITNYRYYPISTVNFWLLATPLFQYLLSAIYKAYKALSAYIKIAKISYRLIKIFVFKLQAAIL